MTPLSRAEEDHLLAFRSARPDWSLATMSDRVKDEMDGHHVHKYPKSHPYVTGMKFVLNKIRSMTPCKVVDIGSPLMQNVALACLPGVQVSVIDVRPHEDAESLGLDWRTASATALPFADESCEIVTSLWVMGHVGDGRYGDPLMFDGDLKMLAEVARILKPGGTAIIGPGLVDEHCGNVYNMHRIYSWPWLREAFDNAGFELREAHSLFVEKEIFIERVPNELHVLRKDGAYALAVLKKK